MYQKMTKDIFLQSKLWFTEISLVQHGLAQRKPGARRAVTVNCNDLPRESCEGGVMAAPLISREPLDMRL